MSDGVYCGWQVANQGHKACPSSRCITTPGAGSDERSAVSGAACAQAEVNRWAASLDRPSAVNHRQHGGSCLRAHSLQMPSKLTLAGLLHAPAVSATPVALLVIEEMALMGMA